MITSFINLIFQYLLIIDVILNNFNLFVFGLLNMILPFLVYALVNDEDM